MTDNATPATRNDAPSKPMNVRGYLDLASTREEITRALPSHMTADRMLRVATTALLKTPGLQKCSIESFARAMLDCSALGLEPDGRRAHLIPYGDVCTLIVDYKGLIELAKRNGDVSLWRPQTVKEADSFSWTNGTVSHSIDFLRDRGNLVAVYSHVRTRDGVDDYEVMTLAECEAIRARSKAGRSGPWVTDFEAMCCKTVMKRHSKRLVLSPEFRDALEKDGDRFEDLPRAEILSATTTQAAAEKLRQIAATPEPTPEPAKPAESLDKLM